MRTITVFISLIISVLAGRMAYAEQPGLVPWPQKVTMDPGSIVLPVGLRVETGGDDREAAGKVAKTLADDLHELGFTPDSAEQGDKITLGIKKDDSLGEEGYRLRVTKGIQITAATEKGLFWETRTALQLVAKGPGASVSRLTIWDKPAFWYRGVMVDVARQFHSIEFHRRTIKRLAQYKVAFYQIHFCEVESYTLPSEKFPSLPTPGRHYTNEELRDLVKLAEQYHVTIVPEIDVPGHASALCKAVPDLVCRGKQPSEMICVGSDRAFAAITALVSEAMDIFPGPYFHIGADECRYNAWDGCPECAAAIAREKLKDNEALYNAFINRMNWFVKSNERKTVIWEGFKVGKEPVVDKDVLVMEFAVEYAMPGELLNAGYDLINSACCPLYLVRHWKTVGTTPEHLAEWNALYFAGGHPSKGIGEMIKVEPSPRLKGICFCSWENEELPEESMMFGIGPAVKKYAPPAPRVQIMAERAWTGDATTKEDLLQRVGVKPTSTERAENGPK